MSSISLDIISYLLNRFPNAEPLTDGSEGVIVSLDSNSVTVQYSGDNILFVRTNSSFYNFVKTIRFRSVHEGISILVPLILQALDGKSRL